jgi:hypothetical protein
MMMFDGFSIVLRIYIRLSYLNSMPRSYLRFEIDPLILIVPSHFNFVNLINLIPFLRLYLF